MPVTFQPKKKPPVECLILDVWAALIVKVGSGPPLVGIERHKTKVQLVQHEDRVEIFLIEKITFGPCAASGIASVGFFLNKDDPDWVFEMDFQQPVSPGVTVDLS